VFGYLGGGPAPFAVTDANRNFMLAFRALPIVLVMSALSALLFHWGVLQRLVRAHLLAARARDGRRRRGRPVHGGQRFRRHGRGAAASCGPGSRACRAASCSPSWWAAWPRSPARVLFLYASILGKVMPDAVAHLLIASIVSAPAALVIAFLMVPPAGRGDAAASWT
jgi:CNT family concentrative nucleoside transporter